jgi:hypothetical protein
VHLERKSTGNFNTAIAKEKALGIPSAALFLVN